MISEEHNRRELLLALQCGLLDQEPMKFYAASDYIVRILSVVQATGTETLVSGVLF